MAMYLSFILSAVYSIFMGKIIWTFSKNARNGYVSLSVIVEKLDVQWVWQVAPGGYLTL